MRACAREPAAPPAPPSPLRVLFLSDHLGHANGRIHGVTTYFLETLPAFDRARVTPTLCLLQPHHRAEARFAAAGVPPVFLGRTKWDPRSFLDLIRLRLRRQYDHLPLRPARARASVHRGGPPYRQGVHPARRCFGGGLGKLHLRPGRRRQATPAVGPPGAGCCA